MKNSYIQFIISCVFICLTTQVYGSVAGYPFRERAQHSDLIVEGIVERQMDNRSFDKKDLSSFRKKSIFKVSAVYKGNAAEGNSITVFSHMNFVCDTSSKLAEGRRYLLMLKKHKSGFADVNHGRGIWEIVTDESGEQVVVSDSWLKTNGESYEQFKNNIAWALSDPPSWPKAPAIPYEQAKKIALEALSKANVDLKGFVYKEHKPQPLKIGSDIIGIAYKGDPMWYFRWEKPEVKHKRPMPPGTFIFCYVHAHTGQINPTFQRKSLEKAEYNLDRFKKEMDLFDQATDRERKIEYLRNALRYRPNHPDNITVEYRLAVLIGQRTDPQTHQYIETGENKEIYERIVNNYNHMDYYRKEMPNHPRSPQILVPECALRAGFYQKDQEKKQGYHYKAMECLNQTYHRRKKHWETAPAPKKPSEDSPFGGPLEISKWESRMFMWQKRKQDAAEGKVLHKIELRLMKRAVAAYLLTYLSKYDDKNHPSSNQGKISKSIVKIAKDFPDTPMEDYAHECGNIIINVLDRVRLKTN